jgi:hypothetical protein
VGGYAITGDWPKARQLLEAHGVPVRVLDAAVSVTVQEFALDTVIFSGRPFQGHREVSVGGRWRETTRQLPAGSLVVQSGTRRDLLAMLLLEPESDDGLLTWNVFDTVLEKGKVAPVVRLAAPLR